jgi:2,4-dienoyl-CoA reductase-like NADH-dependent reductase (Old Yellow Enzyme family)
MGPQLWHTGAVKSFMSDWVPDAPVESPSGLDAPGVARGVAMTDADIADTIAAFAQAAADARRLGFDTIELHGAHGYLIDQFFWSGSNQRDDRYGGPSIGERARFAAEIVAAVRAAVGPDFPIVIRLSQWKQQDYKARLAHTPQEMAQWLEPLVEAGANVLHCSQRRFWEPEFPEIEKLTGAATISVGSVGLSGDFMAAFGGESSTSVGLDRLLERMERNEFDLIAVGRALLTDSHWVAKVRDGEVDSLRGFEPAALRELV